MPARETVAGEAVDKSSVSNNNVTCIGIDIRSPFANVNNLLSSINEFIDSIHDGSIGASKRINFSSDFSSIINKLIIPNKLNTIRTRANLSHNHTKYSIIPFIAGQIELSI